MELGVELEGNETSVTSRGITRGSTGLPHREGEQGWQLDP